MTLDPWQTIQSHYMDAFVSFCVETVSPFMKKIRVVRSAVIDRLKTSFLLILLGYIYKGQDD